MALNLKEVLARIGHPCKATVYSWMARGTFPQPIRIGPRKVVWDEAEVDLWWANRRAASPAERESDRAKLVEAIAKRKSSEGRG